MPPVKTRSAQSRSASVNSSVLRLISLIDQERGSNAATVIRPSGDAGYLAPKTSAVRLKFQFGFEHFKQYDFLRNKEVVLTFDDGPWLVNTPTVLKALADERRKATFFEIASMRPVDCCAPQILYRPRSRARTWFCRLPAMSSFI